MISENLLGIAAHAHPQAVLAAESVSVERTRLGTGAAAVQLSPTDFCSVNCL